MPIPKLRKTADGSILCFDLEARPLAFWYGDNTTKQITAFGWKWAHLDDVYSMVLCSDGKFRTGIGYEFSEEDAYDFFVAEVERATLVYGHNIRQYDLPLLNGWLLRLGMRPLRPLMTTDTLRDIPKRGPMSASLVSLASLYGLEGEKLSMTTPDWEMANELAPEGVERARERVVGDVLLQERLRAKLLDLGILGGPRKWFA